MSHLFAVYSKLKFSFQSFIAMPTLMFVLAHLYNVNIWLINNVGIFQENWDCVVGCFCLIFQSSYAKTE